MRVILAALIFCAAFVLAFAALCAAIAGTLLAARAVVRHLIPASPPPAKQLTTTPQDPAPPHTPDGILLARIMDPRRPAATR